jgi:hypothetical protein
LAVTANITSGNANLGNSVTANFFTGNGIYLTGITTSGASNGNSNVSIPVANGNITMSAVGNANIVVVTGTGANITGTINVTGNAVVGNLISSGSGGNITNVNVVSANTFTASGNITAANLVGILANGNSNISIPTANGNINISAGGTPNELVITNTGINVAGTLNVTGTATVSNINLVTITQPAVSATLTLANGSSLITSGAFSTTLTSTATTNATLPAGTSKLGYLNVPQSGGADKTGSYTLATTDVGQFISIGSGGSVIVPNATFSTGDALSIYNNTSANATITCSIANAYISGTDTVKASVTLATRGVTTILFISSTVCVLAGSIS